MSDEVAAWKARIYQLNRMRADIDAEHRALSQRIAALVAKWRPGQRVVHRGLLYEVTSVAPGYGVCEVRYFGRRVTQTGALGKAERELWDTITGAEARRVATASFPVTATPHDQAAAIASARLEEREACAKLCESLRDELVNGTDQWGRPCPAKVRITAAGCARAIRARTKDQEKD